MFMKKMKNVGIFLLIYILKMNTLPQELIQSTLLHLSYGDIINYCHSHSQGMEIYRDKLFWFNKLDYDKSYITQDGEKLLPSYYVINYGEFEEDGASMYRRWNTMAEEVDIIIFRLLCGTYDIIQSQHVTQKIIERGDVNLISKLLTLGYAPSESDITVAVKMDQLTL